VFLPFTTLRTTTATDANEMIFDEFSSTHSVAHKAEKCACAVMTANDKKRSVCLVLRVFNAPLHESHREYNANIISYYLCVRRERMRLHGLQVEQISAEPNVGDRARE
jgi:ribonucleotide reductase beta subunit family protein with ferritin-like domain